MSVSALPTYLNVALLTCLNRTFALVRVRGLSKHEGGIVEVISYPPVLRALIHTFLTLGSTDSHPAGST
ncbi:hypothetical protein B0H16DRAFT_1733683 [Mycena metata]|uniref:Uncharacterized protein n=1 Tax=Mycena metata TaxID=1033252 RepID=A0AAD7MTX7_9AGAR|nr:hypothetical protein B0H16DRAFT_1733683 [Mycena metata]